MFSFHWLLVTSENVTPPGGVSLGLPQVRRPWCIGTAEMKNQADGHTFTNTIQFGGVRESVITWLRLHFAYRGERLGQSEPSQVCW